MSLVTSLADSAVGRAVIEHGQDLLRFIARRKRFASEDQRLARETYSRLARMSPDDLSRDPQTYLFRVAGNLLHEFELERQPESAARRLFKAGSIEALTRESDCAVDNAVRSVRAREILQELTPLSRAALILHRRDGMSFEQIADQLDVSPARVRQAFTAGLRHYCRQLRQFE
jgi:RNA polymerase sigma-19 factor, ECF subfamily